MRIVSIFIVFVLLQVCPILKVVSTAFAQTSDCIVINSELSVITGPTCANAKGSIKNLSATNASSYVWTDDRGNAIAFTLDLEAGPGIYQLKASNEAGCATLSAFFNIPMAMNNLPNYNVYGINAACELNNGSLHVEIKNLLRPSKVRWTNDAGVTIGSEPDIYNLDVGTYHLYLTDADGCEVLYKSATLRRILNIAVFFEEAKIVDDVCAQGLGSVTGIKVSNGYGPFYYTWTDAKGAVVGRELDLPHVKAGKYKISITDDCGRASIENFYTIRNNDITLFVPEITSIRLCTPATITLNINNPRPGTYRYYESEFATVPIYESEQPTFNTKVSADQTYYVSFGLGVCESKRSKVTVEIGISSKDIANSISPNGDGVNDFWNLTWLSVYRNAIIKVYNRLGQLVYDYQEEQRLFDGFRKGKELPIGSYYYIIKPGEGCNQLSGTITIIK